MRPLSLNTLAVTLLLGLQLLSQPLQGSPAAKDPFNAYWHQGKAEISSYRLVQTRYGKQHEGQAVLIFVTEDFSLKKQVKLDNPKSAGSDAIPILKLNATRNFLAGIYPYSTMLSVFTPVDTGKQPKTLKSTLSVQDWCGQTFTQCNLKQDAYEILEHSYFESEGDRRSEISNALLEEELWTRLRINPESLPTGKINLIPDLLTHRFTHKPIRSMKATVTRKENSPVAGLSRYLVDYRPELDRTLEITYETAFPHRIIRWTEQYPGTNLVTQAERIETRMLDYWNHHDPEDRKLREAWGLPTD